MLLSEADILDLVRADRWMMEILHVAASLNLPAWMIGAGFIRSKVWDHLHDIAGPDDRPGDIDLIYFDPRDLSKESEQYYEAALRRKKVARWSVKNQARMHLRNGRSAPYKSTEEAIADWPETPTAVAVWLDESGTLHLAQPHGIADLAALIVRPAGNGRRQPMLYRQRIEQKKWQEIWPKLRILDC